MAPDNWPLNSSCGQSPGGQLSSAEDVIRIRDSLEFPISSASQRSFWFYIWKIPVDRISCSSGGQWELPINNWYKHWQRGMRQATGLWRNEDGSENGQ